MKRHLNRRKFIKYVGTSGAAGLMANGPLAILIDAVIRGSLSRAVAEGARMQPRTWVDMRFDGAPPRWVYDLFLPLNQADQNNFVQGKNASLVTQYAATNGRYTSGIYASQSAGPDYGNLIVPYVWRFGVPTAKGGTRPMTQLLANMLQIRGIAVGNPAHPGAASLHYLPLGASKSISALSSDDSDMPIAAVTLLAYNYRFRSQAGKSALFLAGDNLIKSLLSPFQSTHNLSTLRAREQGAGEYLSKAREALQDAANLRHPDSAVIGGAMKGARDLILGSFGDLNAKWNDLRGKYLGICHQVLTTPVLGINDKPIGVATRDARYSLNAVAITNSDLRSLIAPGAVPGTGTNLSGLAEAFAITEFIIANDLSSSITVNMPPIEGLVLNGGAVTHTFDEHGTGTMASLLLNTLQARAHAACLLELIDQIKLQGKWNSTVINVSGEFNRTPRPDGSGSDHSFDGASTVVYSGIIDGPKIIGNIDADATPGTYKGTYGAGVIQREKEMANTRIDLGNVAASFAQLLGVSSPLTARGPLFTVNPGTGVITYFLPQGKIIA